MAKVLTPILQQGIGQPYVALFDPMGMPIKNTLTGIPIGAYMTRFEFLYDEEQENITSINLDTGNPDTVDLKELKENSTIFVQWGYIYPNGEFISSPVRVVKIRDFDCTFDDTGTHIVLKCVDGTGDLRYYPPYNFSDTKEYSLSHLLEGGYNNNIGVIIEEFTQNEPSNQ